jgi:RNA polymerase sigma-70 factor (ECF subfamily)
MGDLGLYGSVDSFAEPWGALEPLSLSGEAVAMPFEDWYRGLYHRLVDALVILAGDAFTAEEVAEEAFARALVRWDRVGVMGSPEGWTYRVAVNVLRRRQRRAALERSFLGRQRPPAPSLPAEARPEVWEAVRSLAPRSREAVVLRYVSDLTEAAVARAMGISEGAVSSLLSEARRHLARRLEGPDR